MTRKKGALMGSHVDFCKKKKRCRMTENDSERREHWWKASQWLGNVFNIYDQHATKMSSRISYKDVKAALRTPKRHTSVNN